MRLTGLLKIKQDKTVKTKLDRTSKDRFRRN